MHHVFNVVAEHSSICYLSDLVFGIDNAKSGDNARLTQSS